MIRQAEAKGGFFPGLRMNGFENKAVALRQFANLMQMTRLSQEHVIRMTFGEPDVEGFPISCKTEESVCGQLGIDASQMFEAPIGKFYFDALISEYIQEYVSNQMLPIETCCSDDDIHRIYMPSCFLLLFHILSKNKNANHEYWLAFLFWWCAIADG